MTRVLTMARKQNSPSRSPSTPEEDPGVYSLKIEPDIVQSLKMVAAGLGMSTPNYVNTRLRVIVKEDLKMVLEKMGIGSDLPPPPPSPKK